MIEMVMRDATRRDLMDDAPGTLKEGSLAHVLVLCYPNLALTSTCLQPFKASIYILDKLVATETLGELSGSDELHSTAKEDNPINTAPCRCP